MAITLFRIFNSTVYTLLALGLFCLTLLTPGDLINQCLKTHRLTNIFIVGGAYIITLLLGILFYASRLYTNRTVLAGIPKSWIPIEKNDVKKSVRRMVVEGLTRSVIIAYQARPRDLSNEENEPLHDPALLVDREHPPWGEIAHPGWSSPASPDLPDLQYEDVIKELPYLMEAKAVSLAPADPFWGSEDGEPDRSVDHTARRPSAPPDPRVVEILQRPAQMGLRAYMGHLTSLGLVDPPELGSEFLALYERARFSAHPLHEDEFRTLMGMFAQILRGMKGLNPDLFPDVPRSQYSVDTESFIGPSDEEGETDTVNYEEPGELLVPTRSEGSSTKESSIYSAHTAPLIQSSPARRSQISQQTPSMHSLRPVSSNVSRSSAGSVIRLAEARTPLDLPYTIEYSGRDI